MKLGELAALTHSRIESGDPGIEISGAAGLDLAAAGQITFLANPKYTPQIRETRASAIFLNEKEPEPERSDLAVVRAADPYLAYTRALRAFYPGTAVRAGVHPGAVVHESAIVADSAEIMANAVVGANCRVGERVRIHPNVTVYDGAEIGADSELHSGVAVRENCVVGERCVIHNNTTVGSDGFGYAKDEEKRWLKIPQIGRVVIEDDVEIGANCCVDRAGFGETRIRRGAKFDNLIQIGHNVEIGEDTVVAALAGFSGGTRVGRACIIAGQIGTNQHITIGDGAIITARTGVTKSVESGKLVGGMMPAMDYQAWRRSQVLYSRLPELFERLKKLEKAAANPDGPRT